MGLKQIFEKQGGMNLLKQYWNGGAFFTAVGEFILLGKDKKALEILRLSAQYKIKHNLEKKYEMDCESVTLFFGCQFNDYTDTESTYHLNKCIDTLIVYKVLKMI